jgi:hypothetical protein
MTALTRGPLPARVYWRRRLLLALLVLGLVVVAVRLLGPGPDASSGGQPQATQVAAEPSPDAAEPSVDATDTPSETRERQQGAREEKQDRGPVLAEPEGVCSDRDVAVTPSVRNPVGGSPITFVLELRTIATPACTWQVSPATLTMKITSGDDDIWSSQDCPRAIPSEDVTLRNNQSTKVRATWSGKRSDDECSGLTDWAMPGWYYVDASALAGEPSDLHFELETPEPGVVTKTLRPKPQKQAGQQQEQRGGDEEQDPQRDRERTDGQQRQGADG